MHSRKPQILLPKNIGWVFGSLTGASPERNQRIWEYSHLENSVSWTTAWFPQSPPALAVEGLTAHHQDGLVTRLSDVLHAVEWLRAFHFLIFVVYFCIYFFFSWGLFKSQSWSCLASHSWNKAKVNSLNRQSGKCSPFSLHTPCTRISCLCSGCAFWFCQSQPCRRIIRTVPV